MNENIAYRIVLSLGAAVLLGCGCDARHDASNTPLQKVVTHDSERADIAQKRASKETNVVTQSDRSPTLVEEVSYRDGILNWEVHVCRDGRLELTCDGNRTSVRVTDLDLAPWNEQYARQVKSICDYASSTEFQQLPPHFPGLKMQSYMNVYTGTTEVAASGRSAHAIQKVNVETPEANLPKGLQTMLYEIRSLSRLVFRDKITEPPQLE